MKLSCNVPQRDIFLNDIIGNYRLTLKFISPKVKSRFERSIGVVVRCVGDNAPHLSRVVDILSRSYFLNPKFQKRMPVSKTEFRFSKVENRFLGFTSAEQHTEKLSAV